MGQLIRLADRADQRGDEHSSAGSDDDTTAASSSTSLKDFHDGPALAHLSDAEVGQFVSVALEDALIALG